MKTTIIVLLALLAVSVFFLASAENVSALIGNGKIRNLRKNRGLKKRRNLGIKNRSNKNRGLKRPSLGKWRINFGKHKSFGGLKTLGNKRVDLYGKRNLKKNRKFGRKFRKINKNGRKNRKARKNRKNRKYRNLRNKGKKY